MLRVIGVMPSVHHIEKLMQIQSGGLAGFVRREVCRDNRHRRIDRRIRSEGSPARQVLRRIDLFRLAQIGIVSVCPIRMSVAIVATGGIDQIAAETAPAPSPCPSG